MYLGCSSLNTSCNLPGDRSCEELRAASHTSCDVSITLFGLARRGVCHAFAFTCKAVRFYRTVSPVPPGFPVGGLFSVALSVALSQG